MLEDATIRRADGSSKSEYNYIVWKYTFTLHYKINMDEFLISKFELTHFDGKKFVGPTSANHNKQY